MKRFSPRALFASLPEVQKTFVVERPVWEGEDRASDAFNRIHSEQEVLEWLRFTPAHSDHSGEHWTRPGKDARDGSSATVYSDDEGTHVTIWSDTVVSMFPALEVRRPYDAYGLFVGALYKGDFAKANRNLNDEGYGTPIEGPDGSLIDDIDRFIKAEDEARLAEEANRTGWEPVNAWSVLNGAGEPPPDLFERTDGQFLLYRGKVHAFLGEPESLKSWGAQVAVAQAITAGSDCLILDFENGATSVFSRFLGLGLPKDVLARHLVYVSPSAPFTVEAQAQVSKLLERNFAIIIVDGVTDAMALMGLDPEKNKDAAIFDHQLLRPLARSGAAVVQLDHVAKNSESRGRWGIGAQHKQAAVTGAAFMFEVAKPFGKGMEGMARIQIKKDKPGHLRQLAVGETIAELHLKSHEDGHVTHEVKPPTPGEGSGHRPTDWMVRLSEFIHLNPGLPRRAILQSLGGAQSPWAESAFAMLVAEKWIIDDLPNGAVRGYRSRVCFTALEAGLDIRDADVAKAQNEADGGPPPVNLTPAPATPLARVTEELERAMDAMASRVARELGSDEGETPEAELSTGGARDDLDSLLDDLDRKPPL